VVGGLAALTNFRSGEDKIIESRLANLLNPSRLQFARRRKIKQLLGDNPARLFGQIDRMSLGEGVATLLDADHSRFSQLAKYESQAKEGSSQDDGINNLISLTREINFATSDARDSLIKQRQELIKTLVGNGRLDAFVTEQINNQFEVFKAGYQDKLAGLSPEKRQYQERLLLQETNLIVLNEINYLLGDVVSQEKFAEIESKGTDWFKRTYVGKLF
jgi:hypothetical protein